MQFPSMDTTPLSSPTQQHSSWLFDAPTTSALPAPPPLIRAPVQLSKPLMYTTTYFAGQNQAYEFQLTFLSNVCQGEHL